MTVRPVRLQLSRKRGFNLQALSRATNGLEAVRVRRPGALGNPYVIGGAVDMSQVRRWGWDFSPAGRLVVCKDAREARDRFWHCLLWDEAVHDFVRQAAGGKNVACVCEVGEPCHGDPVLWLANSTPADVHRIQYAIDQRMLIRLTPAGAR